MGRNVLQNNITPSVQNVTAQVPIQQCPSGYPNNVAGVCYPNCPSGWTRQSTECVQNGCPSGFTENEYTCTMNNGLTISRTNTATLPVGVSGVCSSSQTEISGECYPNCTKAGYQRTTANPTECTEECPSGFSDQGIYCSPLRTTIDSGPESNPSYGVCPSGKTMTNGLCYDTTTPSLFDSLKNLIFPPSSS